MLVTAPSRPSAGAQAASKVVSFSSDNTATADSATFIVNGGMGAGLSGTSLVFTDVTTAANANITAKGGVGGSNGGVISFQKTSKGGSASIALSGNGKLDPARARLRE